MNDLLERRTKRQGGKEENLALRRRHDIVLVIVALSTFATVGPLSALFLYASTNAAGPPQIDEYGALMESSVTTLFRIEESSGEEEQRQPPSDPLPVYIFPHTFKPEKAGEAKHFLWDGVARSKRLRRTTDPDEDGAVWLVDVIRFKCQVLIPEVKASICRRLANDTARLNATGINAVAPEYLDGNCTAAKFSGDGVDTQFYGSHRPHIAPAWRVYIVDYTDDGYRYWPTCAEKLSALLGGPEYVRLATRGHVKGRLVKHSNRSEDQPFHDLGAPINWTAYRGASYLGGVPRALRYGVRSDLVDFYEEDLNGTFPYDHGSVETVERPGETSVNVLDLPSLPRERDVAYFWQYGSDTKHGSHRDAIARTVQDIGTKNGTLRVYVGTVGFRSGRGRNNVQSLYARELLKYKIVVVCQRDRWEGHYRLMEALAGGAMVLTDPMHPLPVFIEDQKSVVVYNSLFDLRQKIYYYLDHSIERLEIARRGHEVAMTQHRSWHGLERLVFGNWSSVHGIR